MTWSILLTRSSVANPAPSNGMASPLYQRLAIRQLMAFQEIRQRPVQRGCISESAVGSIEQVLSISDTTAFQPNVHGCELIKNRTTRLARRWPVAMAVRSGRVLGPS